MAKRAHLRNKPAKGELPLKMRARHSDVVVRDAIIYRIYPPSRGSIRWTSWCCMSMELTTPMVVWGNEMNPGILRCGVNPSRMQSLKWVISSLTRTKNWKQEDINGRFIQKLNMKYITYITCKCFSYSNLRFFNLIVDDKRPSPAWPRTDPICWSVKVITGVPTVID